MLKKGTDYLPKTLLCNLRQTANQDVHALT